MNDTTFYQRINLLEEDALEEVTVAGPRRVRRLGKARRIAMVALLYTGLATLLIFAVALALGETVAAARGGALMMTWGCALVTVLMFGLAALKGRLTE